MAKHEPIRPLFNLSENPEDNIREEIIEWGCPR